MRNKNQKQLIDNRNTVKNFTRFESKKVHSEDSKAQKTLSTRPSVQNYSKPTNKTEEIYFNKKQEKFIKHFISFDQKSLQMLKYTSENQTERSTSCFFPGFRLEVLPVAK